MNTIVLTGGGSAGHCTPHLALLPFLKNDFDKIYYIGSEKGIEKDIIKRAKIPYYHVSCGKFNRKALLKNITMPFKVLTGIKEAGKILDKLKPDVIFSKGGYVSVPTVIAAKKRNIPVVAHESDFSMGLANRFTARYCEKVLTSFPETAKEIKNGEFSGPPIRKMNIDKKSAKTFGFTEEKPVLLVIGGSLGAKTINSVLYDSLAELTAKFNVLHICGKGNADKSIKNKNYYQTEFLHDVDSAFSIANVCVSRAGSNSVFELLHLKIPTLFIPLPKGTSRGDQVLNASYFQKLGLAGVLTQENLTKESFIYAVKSLYASRFALKENFSKHPVQDNSRRISRILADSVKI